MGISRLDNFLKSVRGTILYVDPNSIDSTDSVENQGNSLTRPFRTLQRALIESARFSYQRGLDNDRFAKTTIVLYPGDHVVDNRPGWIPDNSIGTNYYRLRDGSYSSNFSPFDSSTNFDLTSPDNILYKFNSVHGGVIIPRGTSVVGMDLRKTKIRPLYVPCPGDDCENIDRSAIFRVTGACYFWQFTVLDADPNGLCFKDYSTSKYIPNFSHHKLTAFEYADGVNSVSVDYENETYSTDRTDLEIYYEKVGLAYGSSSGREIYPDYPSSSIDIQPLISEYQIVGSRGGEIGITSIRSGNGITPTKTITVAFNQGFSGLAVDTPIQIKGVSAAGYDGQYVVSEIISDTEVKYEVQSLPINPLPGTEAATLNLVVDTVTSASPYIFNVSLRSVYGMCGLLADGDKADGFKSMVVAQYTGIGLQKDDNAFVRYDSAAGEYRDSTAIDNLHTDSYSRFKPEYENFHIKAINDAYLQLVSVFAIGYASHFVAENGGDLSINNSNSNFGSKALVASGFKRNAFTRDDQGYITHIITPKELETSETSVEFYSIDVGITTSASAGAATTSRLYLYDEKNLDNPPSSLVDGYRVGARNNDSLYVEIAESGIINEYSASIIIPETQGSGSEISYEKSFSVSSITNNTITLSATHSFINGESIRINSDNGHLPDGLLHNQVYYVIYINSTQIQVAQTLNDAVNVPSVPISLNSKGGNLSLISRVSDKKSGDIGHPVQYDSTIGNWYITVSNTLGNNTIYSKVKSLGNRGLGNATSRTYLKRRPDTRSLIDTIYRVRYVIPKDSLVTARPPLDGYIIQESSNEIGYNDGEIQKYFNPNSVELVKSTELRLFRFISNASWSGNIATINTELPHNLKIGSQVKIEKVSSGINTNGIDDLGYNGIFTVKDVNHAKQFTYDLGTNPLSFTNDTSTRDSNLPRFYKKRLPRTYQIYRSQEIKTYIPNVQDGVYHLVLVNSSNSPTVAPFNELSFTQSIQNLYPQLNRDDPRSDAESAKSFADPNVIGKVSINEPQNSITKETIQKGLLDLNVGFGITSIISNAAGTAHTIFTAIDHGLCGITTVSVLSGGSGYSQGVYYNASLVGYAGSTTGSYATARVTVSAAGTVSGIKILHGGSAYGVGNTLGIYIPSLVGYTTATVRVSSIYNNRGDSISISGINTSYNTLYKITGITTGNTKRIELESSTVVINPSVAGLGSDLTSPGLCLLTGNTLGISTLQYNIVTGITTIGFNTTHGFRVNQKLRLSGASDNFFNKDYIVKELFGTPSTSLTINAGIATTAVSTGGQVTIYRHTLGAFGGELLNESENTSSRISVQYAGITTVISSRLEPTSSDPITIANAVAYGFNIGDYLLINDEIFRIKTNVTNNSITVFRSLFGSRRQDHLSGSVVRKINITPIELRRNSIIRASGHTFEYVGFGPGNYSTSLPDKQDRIISPQEELLAQSTKIDGGVSIFSAMNSDGDFYTGNKKVNSATGQEEIFDSPIPTETGEDPSVGNINIGFDVISPLEIFVNRSIKVEGGPERNVVSKFNAPVIFNNKITCTSEKGIEANSLFVQGDANVSRKFTISRTQPTLSGNSGDIVTNSNPSTNGYLGWVYTNENSWQPFGFIGTDRRGVGISTGTVSNYLGFATMINITGTGLTINGYYNPVTGIATVNFGADPRIGIYTGNNADYFIGNASKLNFVGYGVSVRTRFNSVTGLTTVIIENIPDFFEDTINLPTGDVESFQYNAGGGVFGGANIFKYDVANSRVRLQGSSTTDLFKIVQSGIGNAVRIENGSSGLFVITNAGLVGIGSLVPAAKLDIYTTSDQAIKVKSTVGGVGDIVRIENASGDQSPFIINRSGKVGINTIAANNDLDVFGNAGITGQSRHYNSNITYYAGFKANSTLQENLIWTLPSTVGSANSILTTDGVGTLGWTSPGSIVTIGITAVTTDNLNEGDNNLYYSDERAQDAIWNAIDAGIKTGITITYDDANNSYNFNVDAQDIINTINNITITGAPYPFTTRGFSYVL